MKTLPIIACILRLISPFAIKQALLEENFEEMSEIHWENMFYLYFSADSCSLVNISYREWH